MNESLHRTIEKYAEMVLEWLDIDSKECEVKRSDLLELFIDTLSALNQAKEQED